LKQFVYSSWEAVGVQSCCLCIFQIPLLTLIIIFILLIGTHLTNCHFSFSFQSTGVVVDDVVATTFQAFKLGQGEKLRYYVYKIENKSKIVIDKKGEKAKTFDDFCGELPEDDCRYGLIDIDFETVDGRPTSKLVFITWNPDTASVRNKMLYSGSKEALKTALNGVSIHINATDASELDWETAVLPACRKFA
jgi:cofilin